YVDGPCRVEAGTDADAVLAGFESDLVRADLFTLGGKFDGGLGRARRVDGEIDREALASEDGAGDTDGFGFELGLRAASEPDGVDRDTELACLPCGTSCSAGVFVAVGDKRNAMQHTGGQGRHRLADGRFEIGAAGIDAGCAGEFETGFVVGQRTWRAGEWDDIDLIRATLLFDLFEQRTLAREICVTDAG